MPHRDHPRAFGRELAAALYRRDQTLTWLQRRLADNGTPVSMTTLSYWRSGARRPEGLRSRDAVREIERLLDLPSGHLERLIGPTHRTGPLPPMQSALGDADLQSQVAETLDALGCPESDNLRDITTHLTAEMDETGSIRHCITKGLLQATRGTLTEFAVVNVAPAPRSTWSTVSALRGVTLKDSYQHPGMLVEGRLFELLDPAQPGETALYEFTETYPDDHPPQHDLWHATTRPSHEIVVWAEFHPNAIPHWCESFVHLSDGEEVAHRRSPAPPVMHIARQRFGPGVVGLRWGFDEQR
jgi:hypothetical protein